jgi:selenocysteine-specific elongation factor
VQVGICVTQLDPKAIERGLAAAPGSVPTFSLALAQVEKIRFFAGGRLAAHHERGGPLPISTGQHPALHLLSHQPPTPTPSPVAAGQVASKAKLHISVGHATVMAELLFFGLQDGLGVDKAAAMQQLLANLQQLATGDAPPAFDFSRECVPAQSHSAINALPLPVATVEGGEGEGGGGPVPAARPPYRGRAGGLPAALLPCCPAEHGASAAAGTCTRLSCTGWRAGL